VCREIKEEKKRDRQIYPIKSKSSKERGSTKIPEVLKVILDEDQIYPIR